MNRKLLAFGALLAVIQLLLAAVAWERRTPPKPPAAVLTGEACPRPGYTSADALVAGCCMGSGGACETLRQLATGELADLQAAPWPMPRGVPCPDPTCATQEPACRAARAAAQCCRHVVDSGFVSAPSTPRRGGRACAGAWFLRPRKAPLIAAAINARAEAWFLRQQGERAQPAQGPCTCDTV